MNKNSLKQMIVAEMILADVEGRDRASPKKRSLFEMMEDSYLAELEDGRLAHSMESVGNLFEETPKDNWKVTDPISREKRAPKTSGPRSPAQQAVIDADTAARAKTRAEEAAAAANPPAEADPPPASTPEVNPGSAEAQLPTITQPQQLPTEIVDTTKADAEVEAKRKEQDAINAPEATIIFPDNERTKIDPGDSEGREDSGDSDPANPSSGLAYLDSLAQKEINAAQGVPDADVKSESRLSLIDLLYDA